MVIGPLLCNIRYMLHPGARAANQVLLGCLKVPLAFRAFPGPAQTTANHFIDRLEGLLIRLTQLAHGLPVGGELDYLDEGTLAQALRARRPVG